MERVVGLGGIFFKASDPEKLAAWNLEHLGLDVEKWAESGEDAAARLRTETAVAHLVVAVLRPTDGEIGVRKFGWPMDPEGTRIELWEPPLVT